MTRRGQFTVLGAACIAAIVVPGLFIIRMRAAVQRRPVKTGSIHPVMNIPRARLGGIVREVLVRNGQHVEAGQVLLRLEAKEWEARLQQLKKASQAAENAVKGGDALSQVPNQLRQYLYEVHPDTVKAERDYVDALALFDKSAGANREAANVQLQQASEQRMLVRRRLARLFSGSAKSADSRVYLTEIARSIAEVGKVLQDAEVRAPAQAVVDLMEAHAGDRIQLGQPLAVLISAGEYSVDLAVTETELKRLQTSMALKGRLQGNSQRIEGRIETITTRKLPVIARDNLQTAEEPVVRVRILSATALRAGSMAAFELP